MMPGAIQKWIPQILEAKLIQDEIDTGAGRTASSMKTFIEEYFPRKYGLPALAKKATAELFNGLRKFLGTHKRIAMFGVCCGVEVDDKNMARDFTQFMLKCIERCVPVEAVTEKMSKKECEVDVETVNRALEYLFKGELAPVTPAFREQFINMCRAGKKNKSQPALEIDDFLCRCMQVSKHTHICWGSLQHTTPRCSTLQHTHTTICNTSESSQHVGYMITFQRLTF